MSILFQDRKQAGKELAIILENYLQEKFSTVNNKDLIVLAIPRGGVIIGDIISSHLGCNFDIIVTKKIGVEENKELAIGAVLPDGSYILTEDIINTLNVSSEYIAKEVQIQKLEVDRRLEEYRGNRAYDDKIKEKVVILVDDGIATGATIIAASRWIKEKKDCKILIVAVPVIPSRNTTVSKLNQIANKVISLYMPEQFYAVGQFYKEFNQISDEEVKAIMNKHIIN